LTVHKRIALLALAAVVAVGACGGDDESDEAEAGDGATATTAQGSSTDDASGDGATGEPAAALEGYTDEHRSLFVTACAAQPGASEAKCECAFDEIAGTVPFEEYSTWEQAARQDPTTPPPDGVVDAVTACS
jgi:hypothetical protein